VARNAIELAWLAGALQWKHDEARTWLALADAAIERLGGDAELQGDHDITRGVLAQQEDRYEEALSAFEQAIRLDPNYALAYYNKGVALENLKRYDEALVAYEQTIRFNPNFALAYFGKGNALNKLGYSV